MKDIEDRLCLTIPTGPNTNQKRWWSIRQPRPSFALSFQGRLTAAFGPGVFGAIHELLVKAANDSQKTDDGGERVREYHAVKEALGDEHALASLRRARAGGCLVAEGESMVLSATRLRALIHLMSRKFGVNLNAIVLFGEVERKEENMDSYWAKPSLIHQLLIHSELTFEGTGDEHSPPSGMETDDSPGAKLWKALNYGRTEEYIRELDDLLVSAEELAMLSAWAVLHLYRPF